MNINKKSLLPPTGCPSQYVYKPHATPTVSVKLKSMERYESYCLYGAEQGFLEWI